jgi:hypothetical protein
LSENTEVDGRVAVLVGMSVGGRVLVGVSVIVGVNVEVKVDVGEFEGTAVGVIEGIGAVAVNVRVGEMSGVGVWVGETSCVGVWVTVGVSDGV